MGRTLWYELHLPCELAWNEWKEIRAAQAVMNLRCTWTCEELSIGTTRTDERQNWSRDHHGDPAPCAWGFTKVAGDEWNAALVIAFAMWLSIRFRDMSVHLHDEGALVRGGYVIIRHGEFVTDHVRVDRQRAYLASHGRGDLITGVDAACADASAGRIFENTSIFEYRDRQEVKAIGLSKQELRSLTVSDVVKRLPIPWFYTCVKTS